MRALLLGFLLLVAEPTLAAEKYVGSNVHSRTILAFKVADAAVQKLAIWQRPENAGSHRTAWWG
jgi:hypothetical protein